MLTPRDIIVSLMKVNEMLVCRIQCTFTA